MQEFYSHGKLLISGEYLVLEGAKALAVPLNKGQKMRVSKSFENMILWNSFFENRIWFTAQFSLKELGILSTSDEERAIYIQQLLQKLKTLSSDPDLLSVPLVFGHELEFDPAWGMGSSSTLINNLAAWAKIDAYELLAAISKGSGYDIACAKANGPIFFQKVQQKIQIETASFNPEFHPLLHFVYSGIKQNSEKNIREFLPYLHNYKNEIAELSSITDELCKAKNPEDFAHLIEHHEKIIASVTQQPTAKEICFPDYTGCIKSLGAWGGDFVLAINTHNDKNDLQYFQQKGFPIYLNYKELVL